MSAPDGSEGMPLTELAEYERYIEWRDSSCVTTEGTLTASELVDAHRVDLPELAPDHRKFLTCEDTA